MHLKIVSIWSFLVVFSSSRIEAKPTTGNSEIHILRYENTQSEDNYKFDFHTSDGQKREETGILVNGGQELVVRGSYSYTGPDNIVYLVEYVADRNGFQPKVVFGRDPAEEDSQTKRPFQISPAGFDTDTAIRPHALKSLLG